MSTLVSDQELDIQGRDRTDENRPIVPDLEKLLAHPKYGESISTIQRMASDVEDYLQRFLVKPTSSRFTVAINRISSFLSHWLLRHKKPISCACGQVLLKHGICRTCFERELKVLRQIRPEMEAGVEAASRLGFGNKQAQAHISVYCAKIPTVLLQAVGEALKIWIFDVLNVYTQIWGSDIPDKDFHHETLKITEVAVPSKGLIFLQKLTANNDKLPRRSVSLRVYIKGTDPYLGVPFDIGVLCGLRNAIVIAVHQWD